MPPIFDYKCECGNTMERLAKPDTRFYCNKCGELMKKELSSTKAFILKGEGFYKPSKS